MAVSPESMTDEEPSKTALATSEASARVGLGACTIDSSICVAVMTGRPTAMQRRMISFCRCGSSSMGNSDPRSPRATMTAPEASMIESRFSTAARVSILATTSGPRGKGSVPIRRTSWAERTNESASMSTPASTKASASRRSSGGGGGHAEAIRGDVDAGPPLEQTAVDDLDVESIALAPDAANLDGAVAEGQVVAVVHVGEQVVVVDLHHVAGALPLARHEGDHVEVGQVHAVAGHAPGTDLGAGQVDDDAERTPHLGRDRAHPVVALEGQLEGLVGEAEPGDVHPGLHHRAEGRLVVRCGADGGDDLRPTGHERQRYRPWVAPTATLR